MFSGRIVNQVFNQQNMTIELVKIKAKVVHNIEPVISEKALIPLILILSK